MGDRPIEAQNSPSSVAAQDPAFDFYRSTLHAKLSRLSADNGSFLFNKFPGTTIMTHLSGYNPGKKFYPGRSIGITTLFPLAPLYRLSDYLCPPNTN